MRSEKLREVVVQGMLDKKAKDIVVLDMRKVKSAIADFFVICTGTSDTQIEAIADSIDEQVYKQLQENPWHIEGKTNREWMLLDYVNVVAHIFKKEKRDFFALENLWGDAVVEHIKEEA
ncbi:MAG: ribosome silencing factor [Candidatus Cyclobacteriaceae bacterium M2_1C_046]